MPRPLHQFLADDGRVNVFEVRASLEEESDDAPDCLFGIRSSYLFLAFFFAF